MRAEAPKRKVKLKPRPKLGASLLGTAGKAIADAKITTRETRPTAKGKVSETVALTVPREIQHQQRRGARDKTARREAAAAVKAGTPKVKALSNANAYARARARRQRTTDERTLVSPVAAPKARTKGPAPARSALAGLSGKVKVKHVAPAAPSKPDRVPVHEAKSLGGLVKNAYREVRDTVIAAPAIAAITAKGTGKFASEHLQGLVPGAAGHAHREKASKMEDQIVSSTLDTPAGHVAQAGVAAARGKGHKALKELKVAGEQAYKRPVGAIASVIPAAKGADLAIARTVHTAEAVKTAKAIHVRPKAREVLAQAGKRHQVATARPAKVVRAKPVSGTTEKLRADRGRTKDEHAKRARGGAPVKPEADVLAAKQRSYPKGHVAKKVVVKREDRAARKGQDPTEVKGTRRRARLVKKDAVVAVRNVQAAGLSREEHEAGLLHDATKSLGRGRKDEKRAAVQLLANGRVEPASVARDLEDLRRTAAAQNTPVGDRNAKLYAKLQKHHDLFADPAIHKAASELTARSHQHEADLGEHGYFKGTSPKFVRGVQAGIAQGRIGYRNRGDVIGHIPARLEGGGTPPLPPEAMRTGHVPVHLQPSLVAARRKINAPVVAGAEEVVRSARGSGRPSTVVPTGSGAEARAGAAQKLTEVDERLVALGEDHARAVANAKAHRDAHGKRYTTKNKGTGKSEQRIRWDSTEAQQRASVLRTIEHKRKRELVAAREQHTALKAHAELPAAEVRPVAVEPPVAVASADAPPAEVNGQGVTVAAASGYHHLSGPHAGQLVKEEHLNTDRAFLRGTPAEAGKGGGPSIQSSPEGYRPEDVHAADLTTDVAGATQLARLRKQTQVELAEMIQGRYAAGKPGQRVLARADAEQAATRYARSGKLKWEAVDVGKDEAVVLPSAIAKLWHQQTRDLSTAEGVGRVLTRRFVRNVLPFSVSWHAGNAADLMTRVALTGDAHTLEGMLTGQGGQLYRALQDAMGELDPHLRRLMESSLHGHLGSRRTLSEPRFRDLSEPGKKSLFNALSGWDKVPGVSHAGKGYGKLIAKGFDFSAERVETPLVAVAASKAARDYARALGLQVEGNVNLARQLAGEFANDPRKLEEFQRQTLAITGDYVTKSPLDRKLTNSILPFLGWLKAANKFVFYSLPKNHPVKTAFILQAGSLTAAEREQLGLNYYLTDKEAFKLGLPKHKVGYFAGSVPLPSGLSMPTVPFTSFGEAGRILDGLSSDHDRAGNAEELLSTFGGPGVGGAAAAAIKAKRFGPGDQAKVGASRVAEAFLPFGRPGRKLAEGHVASGQTSTLIHPVGVGRKRTVVQTIGTAGTVPLPGRDYPESDKLRAQRKRNRDGPPDPNGTFRVKMDNGTTREVRFLTAAEVAARKKAANKRVRVRAK